MSVISESGIKRQSMTRALSNTRGVTVLHTAESMFDAIGEDTGAEGVARFIDGRSGYGSYHAIADRDSWVTVIPFERGAYHDGTGSNPWAMSLSFACRTTDWRRMTPAHRRSVLSQGALAFLAMEEWKRRNGRPLTALRLLTKAQSDQPSASGFTYHGLRDPGRRTDPGVNGEFPLTEFLDIIRDMQNGDDDMAAEDKAQLARIEAKVDVLLDAVQVGLAGKRHDGDLTAVLRRAQGTLGVDFGQVVTDARRARGE